MPRSRFFLICLLGSLFAADSFAQYPDTRLRVASPDGQIVFILGDANASQALEPGVNDLRYAVDFHGKWLMDESVLGLKLEGQPALGPGMKQVHVQTGQHDETYTIPVQLKSVPSTTEWRFATSSRISRPSTACASSTS